MGWVNIPSAIAYPTTHGFMSKCLVPVSANTNTLNAANKKVGFFGQLEFQPGVSGAKTLSSSGGKIWFRPGSSTWTTAGSTIRVGVQGWDTATGPAATANGTWGPYGDLIQGVNSIPASTWVSCAISNNSASYANGDHVAIVFDMIQYSSVNTINIAGFGERTHKPQVNTHDGTSWSSSSAANSPLVVIEFDDGTVASLRGAYPYAANTMPSWNQGSTYDEFANVFSVPFACKISALFGVPSLQVGSSAVLRLYRHPLSSSPVIMASANILPTAVVGTTASVSFIEQINQVELLPGVQYACGLQTTSSTNVSNACIDFATEKQKMLFIGADATQHARKGGSGAFGNANTLRVPALGVVISALSDASGVTINRRQFFSQR